jgi:hypothetical protein
MDAQTRRQGVTALALTSGAVLLGFVVWFVVSAQASGEGDANRAKEPSTEEDASSTVIRQDPRIEGFFKASEKIDQLLKGCAVRQVQGRNVTKLGNVWIDENFRLKMNTLAIKAQSKAYFRILQKRPELKDVFGLGNHLVWVTPSGTALVVDTKDGKCELSDKDIDQLFAVKK